MYIYCKVVIRGSLQETLNLGLVLYGTHQQGVPGILMVPDAPW